jgi:hypothetical protein
MSLAQRLTIVDADLPSIHTHPFRGKLLILFVLSSIFGLEEMPSRMLKWFIATSEKHDPETDLRQQPTERNATGDGISEPCGVDTRGLLTRRKV